MNEKCMDPCAVIMHVKSLWLHLSLLAPAGQGQGKYTPLVATTQVAPDAQSSALSWGLSRSCT